MQSESIITEWGLHSGWLKDKLWSHFVSFCSNSDYHKKQNTIAALKKKALEKNPDEFYFNMISSQLQVRSVSRSEQQRLLVVHGSHFYFQLPNNFFNDRLYWLLFAPNSIKRTTHMPIQISWIIIILMLITGKMLKGNSVVLFSDILTGWSSCS